ncbi:MAG: PIN domain-containing protein [bacterium]
MRIYIDTSVISGLYAQDDEIKIATENFFEFVQKSGVVLYSAELIAEEIDRTPQAERRNHLMEALAKYDVELLPFSDEINSLANDYVQKKVVPAKYLPDAVHIATASVHNVPVLVSWNFEHIVKLKTKVEINRINRTLGYPQINISSPEEV